MSPRRPRLTARDRRLLADWEKMRPTPRPEARRIPDPFPNLLAAPEGCAEMARMILDNYADLPQGGRRRLALDILENAIDYGFAPPRELLAIMKRELATKPTGVTAKPEYQRALAIKRANPSVSVRALAAEVGVPWPTIARWQRTEYWKLAVSAK
jgi:hypothetical protein